MGEIADSILAAPVAMGFGAAGLLFQLAWPLMRGRRAILSTQFGASAEYGVHYGLLDAWTATAACAIGGAQTLIALVAGPRAWLRYLGLGFVPLAGILAYASWAGATSLLAFAAVSLNMIGRMQVDTLRLRAILLVSAPLAMTHDVLVGAIPALIGGSISFAIASVMFVHEYRARVSNMARSAMLAA